MSERPQQLIGLVRELKIEFASALLLILTVAAVISAAINFEQQGKFHLADDGVTWVARPQGVQALYIVPGSPADRAGIKAGDVVLAINRVPVDKPADVPQLLAGIKAYYKADYSLRRRGVEFKTTLVVGEVTADSALYYQYAVGLAYLAIGLFVFFRRGRAHKARHFYVLCLASFVLSTFHYTGKLNNFDKVMYWGNVAAGLFAPAIFLHFCLAFQEGERWLRGAFRTVLVYLPASLLMAVYLAAGSGTLRLSIPSGELRWLLDRAWMGLLGMTYLAGAAALSYQYRRTEDPVVRRQIQWLRNGAVLGALPFVVFYVIPYVLGAVPGEYMRMAVLTLIAIPVTWAYAVLRYRLMDVDVIFQQGYAYTLATLAVLGLFFTVLFSVGNFDELSPRAAVFLIVVAAFVFQPIRSWIQEQLDRYYFYKDRYDYRRTLVEFARELSSETELQSMLASVADRLIHTLSVRRVAFFLADEAAGSFRLEMEVGAPDTGELQQSSREMLDLSFLQCRPSASYLFFERPRYPLDVISRQWPASVRKTIACLDLTYYVPCSARGRTIAYLGVSRTDKGDFLSSDDVELLVTISGYVGIAIDNSRLYHSLQRKVEENERLREFNENIVESINVGILAADLEDRVESWNSRMEELTGIPRALALGKRLQTLFPPELVERFERVRMENGIHHIYKFVLRPDLIAQTAAEMSSRVNGRAEGQKIYAATVTAGGTDREVILNLAIAPLVSRDGGRIGRLIIFDDVTDRAELEKRLVQADKLSSIGLLAAGVAHEVNTPLAVISTYAQMLAKQISGDEQKSVLLEKIAKQTFRASQIVNSLLNFSRTSPLEFDRIDLKKVIVETMTLVQHQFEKAGVTISAELADDLPLIQGDPGRLQQVFLNLYLNARDAMEGGGVLTVRAHSTEGGVAVEVCDTGKGIAPEHLHRIYDPFFTTKPAKKGTGLGLSVTYGIVREHGGSIEVDSRPGRGTKFRLEFPAVRKTVHA